jgi:mono/diheme cytochrome c family protein
MNMSRSVAIPIVLGIVGCLAGSVLQEAPPKAANMSNPFEDDEQARRAGAKLFARECAACHGANREGRGKAPSLNRPEVLQAPPGALFWVLQNGSLHGGMPSFAHLPEPQRWQIITFLRLPNPGWHRL